MPVRHGGAPARSAVPEHVLRHGRRRVSPLAFELSGAVVLIALAALLWLASTGGDTPSSPQITGVQGPDAPPVVEPVPARTTPAPQAPR